MAVSWKWVRSQVRLRPCLSFITGTSSRLVPTLTQEAASSSHRQNNHWQCKVAGSQVRWGIEATAIKSTWLQWFSPPFPFPYFVNSCCKTNFHKESKCDQKACVCIVFGRPEGKLWKSSLLRYYGAQKASWLGGLSRKEEAQFNTKRMLGGGGHQT